ncbi:YjbH domain-containing protein [Selenomonadales bacterium OttesenSCG-928-I06]|nr:YjbH domain-containing protein [Selenomonadales bacterium OttesenSCG-928-I06]
MKKFLSVFLFVFFISSCSYSLAAPTFNASTGQINTPSADVMRDGQFSVGFYNLQHSRKVGMFILGVTPKLEVGFRRNVYSDSSDNTISAKYSIVKEDILKPGFAIGYEQGTGSEGDSFYGAVSKRLIWGIRLHVGIGNNKYEHGFIALEKSIKKIKFANIGASNVILEYDGKHFNCGIRASVAKNLKVDLGIKDDRGYFGISYTKL